MEHSRTGDASLFVCFFEKLAKLFAQVISTFSGSNWQLHLFFGLF
jgi:hypothetical protein